MELDKKIIGNRIKLERTRIGLTQEELAAKLGLNNKSSISQYENGDAIPGDDIKFQMCDLFGCSLDYLLGKSDIRNYDDFKKKDLKKLQKQLKEKNISASQIETLINYMSKEPFELTYDFEDFLSTLSPEIKEFIIQFDFNSSLKRLQWAIEEQNYRFAYHKETEGLTDEEISDALRFYKKMKENMKNSEK